jgi:hypothetical protein
MIGSRKFYINSGLEDSLEFYVKWKDATSYSTVTSAHTMDHLSSRLANLRFKINRLERQ